MVSVLALFVAVSCSDDSGTTKDDGGTKDDKGVTPDTGPAPTTLTCNNDCSDLVLNKISLPDATSSSKIGYDYDGDGSVDNALGSILGGLSAMAGSLNIQEAVTDGINAGATLVLLRVQADDFSSDDSSKAQAWVAAKMACCSNPDDSAACATEAAAGCFSGGQTFYVDKESPKDAIFGGKIASGGKMAYGPSSLKFILPFTGAGELSLNLKAVHIMGDISSDGKKITNGILAGAITQDELNNNLIPTIKDMLNETLKTSTDQQVKNIITSLFDADSDGTITETEVKDSTVVKTFLGGDVDVDNDGTKELSLGVGFEAVDAVIDETGTPPDGGTTTPDTGTTTPDAGAADAAMGD